MIIAIVSDIHGNRDALRAVMPRLASAERVLFAGDLAGYYPFVAESLAEFDARFICVRGNHDDELLRLADGGIGDEAYERRYGSALRRAAATLRAHDLERVRAWPFALNAKLGGVRFAVTHGAPWDPLQGRVYPDFSEWRRFATIDADVVILGHTHYAMTREVAGHMIVNPGSVGQPRDGGSGAACYALYDTVRKMVTLRRVAYDWTAIAADARVHNPKLPYLCDVFSR